jgi:fucose permease
MARLGRRGTLALVCGVYAGAGLSLSSVGPSLEGLAANVGHEVTAVGAQFSAFSLGTVVVQLAAAPLGGRFGQRALLAGGALLLGLGMLGESLSRELGWLLAFALVGGLGFGCVLAAGVLLVARLFAERGASALNLTNLFFGVGSIVGPLAAGLAGAALGRPELAMLLGAAVLVGLAPALRWAQEAPAPAPRAADEAGGAVPWGLVALLGVLLLLYSGTEIAVAGWAALYLQTSAGVAPTQAALAVSGFWLALTAGRALGAVLGLRTSPSALLGGFLALLLAAAGLLALTVGSGAGTAAALALFGLACGPIFPTTMALVTSVSGGRGGAAGLALAVGNLGAGTIPPLLGVVLAASGARAGVTLLLVTTGLLLGILGLVLLLERRGRRLAAA